MGISVAFRFLVCSQTTRLSLDYYLDVHGLLLSRCFYNNAAKSSARKEFGAEDWRFMSGK